MSESMRGQGAGRGPARRAPSACGLLVVLSLVALSGCKPSGAEAPAPQEQAPVVLGPEDMVRVEPRPLQEGPVLSGTLQARRVATMRAEVQGAVLEMAVEQGQKVKKGQLLARIQDVSQQDQLLSARTAVRVARNALRVARAEEQRNRQLVSAGVITRRDYERTQLARAQAEAQLAEAKSRLVLAREQVGRTRIVAPFAGVVSERHASAGDIIQPGTPLYTVVDPTSLRLEASVPAAQLSVLKPGTGVDFTVNGYGDRSFQGRIERINPAVDPATGQVRLYVTLPNTQQALLTGLFAEGRVAALRREVPAVPVSAVDLRAEPPTVLRVQEGKLARVPVTLGLRDEVARLVELRSGVQAGDILVRSPAQDLMEGARVEVRPPETPREPEPGVGGAGTPPEAAEPH